MKAMILDVDGTLWDTTGVVAEAWMQAASELMIPLDTPITADRLKQEFGKPMDEIAAGIELSVAKRCFVMSKKAGAVDSITLTGGCAKNDGLKEAIEKVLNLKVIDLPIDPQLMGALGAAEFARQKGMAKEGAV